ncbi:hypothetical protein [Fontibacillus sp. BL9]|uniref:hypothetical protein n=1 Tax=Fontibacillus sp. BL9 TaxID=3389971 RepID=UPI00397D5246
MPQWQLKHKSGEFYPSEVIHMNLSDAQSLHQAGWEENFDWTRYLRSNESSTPYKLLVIGNNNYIQGAIAYHVREHCVFVDLLESAPLNRYKTKDRDFSNVTDVLLGEACVQSFAHGKQGEVAFIPKSNLYSYYKTRFGARYGGMRQMYLTSVEAIRLIRLYYK